MKKGNWECPEDYHSVEADETGQCYPNSEECPDDTFLVPDEDEADFFPLGQEQDARCLLDILPRVIP